MKLMGLCDIIKRNKKRNLWDLEVYYLERVSLKGM